MQTTDHATKRITIWSFHNGRNHVSATPSDAKSNSFGGEGEINNSYVIASNNDPYKEYYWKLY
jgi:hypothetical protein